MTYIPNSLSCSHQGFKWTYFVLILCAFCLYSSWRHIFRQYHDMTRDRPTPANLDELAQQINQHFRWTSLTSLCEKWVIATKINTAVHK